MKSMAAIKHWRVLLNWIDYGIGHLLKPDVIFAESMV